MYIGKDQRDLEYYMGSGNLLWASYRKRFGREDLNAKIKSHHKWVYEQNKILNIYIKEILYECDNADELSEKEKYYIEKYNTFKPNGYNIAIGGLGGNLVAGYTNEERKELNKKISQRTKDAMNRDDVRQKFLEKVQNKSEQWKENISKSLTGRKGHKPSDKAIEALRQRSIGNKYGIGNKSRTGQHLSEETKQKISEAQQSIPHTADWNAKVSNSLKGKPKSEEHKQALRKPKPKYIWYLPDGSTQIMSASNGSRHEGWIKGELVKQPINDQ